MSFTVSLDMSRDFEVKASPERVFALLADVPESVSHFPKVEQLVDLGSNTYRWEMEKLGVGSYYIQTVYACCYTDSPDEGWVKWEAVEGEGNSEIEGYWNLEDSDGGTHVEFFTRGLLSLPLPSLAKFVVSPLVVAEFNQLVNRYIENLTRVLDG